MFVASEMLSQSSPFPVSFKPLSDGPDAILSGLSSLSLPDWTCSLQVITLRLLHPSHLRNQSRQVCQIQIGSNTVKHGATTVVVPTKSLVGSKFLDWAMRPLVWVKSSINHSAHYISISLHSGDVSWRKQDKMRKRPRASVALDSDG